MTDPASGPRPGSGSDAGSGIGPPGDPLADLSQDLRDRFARTDEAGTYARLMAQVAALEPEAGPAAAAALRAAPAARPDGPDPDARRLWRSPLSLRQRTRDAVLEGHALADFSLRGKGRLTVRVHVLETASPRMRELDLYVDGRHAREIPVPARADRDRPVHSLTAEHELGGRPSRPVTVELCMASRILASATLAPGSATPPVDLDRLVLPAPAPAPAPVPAPVPAPTRNAGQASGRPSSGPAAGPAPRGRARRPVSGRRRLFMRLKSALRPRHGLSRAEMARVREAFDAQGYLASNPDVAEAGLDPLAHYLRHGWREPERVPAPGFDAEAYMALHPAVERWGADPFVHWARRGGGRPGG